MIIKQAEFVISNTQIARCPKPDKPEFAFIGRSNVGKSSLINLLTGRRSLAKISVKPGKTQTINHFIIDAKWYLVDLPGYGFAGVSKVSREGFGKMIEEYFTQRENLYCTFILIDSRLPPQKIDIDFIEWLGEKKVPIALVLTKEDKLTRNEFNKSKARFLKSMTEIWEELPPLFITSSVTKNGKKEILDFISHAMAQNQN
jgi:GTP-binding protein